jgi:mono/diheme cytochrome c family protein
MKGGTRYSSFASVLQFGPESRTARSREVPMSRCALAVLPVLFFFALWLPAQQNQPAQKAPSAPGVVIPMEAAKQANPVKSTPESLDRAKKWWALDCAMCHGKGGDGKGETARDMKLQIPDFTNPANLKDRSDGEIFYLIKNGHQDMPPEGERLKADGYWDLVNYVRSLAKPQSGEEKPAESKN